MKKLLILLFAILTKPQSALGMNSEYILIIDGKPAIYNPVTAKLQTGPAIKLIGTIEADIFSTKEKLAQITKLLTDDTIKKAINGKTNTGKTPLISATINADSALVKLLLDNGADIEAVDDEGETALQHAIVNNKENTLKVLLAAGAKTNTANKSGNTLLHTAICSNNPKTVALLLEKNLDPCIKNKQGENALAMAKTINLKGLQLMRDDLTEQQNKANNAKIIELLSATQTKQTNSSASAQTSSSQDIKKITETMQITDSATLKAALKSDAKKGLLDLQKMYEKCGNTTSVTPFAIKYAITSNDPELLKLLQQKAPDFTKYINSIYNNETPLTRACRANKVKLAEQLLAFGASVNATNSNGESPLIVASFCAEPYIAELLLQKGAHVDAQDNNKDTALHCAISRINPEMVKILLRHGADMMIKNTQSSPLLNARALPNFMDLARSNCPGQSDEKIKKNITTINQLLENELIDRMKRKKSSSPTNQKTETKETVEQYTEIKKQKKNVQESLATKELSQQAAQRIAAERKKTEKTKQQEDKEKKERDGKIKQEWNTHVSVMTMMHQGFQEETQEEIRKEKKAEKQRKKTENKNHIKQEKLAAKKRAIQEESNLKQRVERLISAYSLAHSKENSISHTIKMLHQTQNNTDSANRQLAIMEQEQKKSVERAFQAIETNLTKAFTLNPTTHTTADLFYNKQQTDQEWLNAPTTVDTELIDKQIKLMHKRFEEARRQNAWAYLSGNFQKTVQPKSRNNFEQ